MFTYDINGDTYTQQDHYLYVNQSFVINPFLLSVEDKVWNEFVNPYLANLNRIDISMNSKHDGCNNCDSDTYICDDGVTDLYMDIEINYEIECNPNHILMAEGRYN